MNIIFASSEIYPYAKTGGLADVASALPEELRNEHKVYKVMPLYKLIDRKKYGIVALNKSFDIWLNGLRHQVDIYINKDCEDDIFLYNPVLSDRDGLYFDNYGDFGDNALRFGIFSLAIIQVMYELGLEVDIFHINDWQTSLVALYAKTRFNLTQKIVLTIHNMAYQGIYPKSVVDELEIDWSECFRPESLEYHDNVNFLKAGIYFSDAVTTVSPTYKDEIQTSYYGCTLEDSLKTNNYKLEGILNGISYEDFNPAKDKNLYRNFDSSNLDAKKEHKIKLLQELHMSGEEKPLFIFIGRFTHQKGIDLLISALELLKSHEVNIAILGSGESYYNNIFESLKFKYPNVHITIGYNEAYARRLYGASDFLIMPSFFEPCGLNQMIAYKYGSMPIVTETGGLKDSVSDFTNVDNIINAKGLGISFYEKNQFWFFHAISKAISLYANKTKFNEITKHNMDVDYSWKESSKIYVDLYKKLLG